MVLDNVRLISCFFLLFLQISVCYANGDDVGKFFNSTTHLVITIIKDNNTHEDQKVQKLRDLFEKNVDIQWMSRFAIARYWNIMNESQRANYINKYHDYVMELYVPKFREYNNNAVTINSIKAMDRGQYIVATQIVSANGKQYDVSYRCKQYDDGTIKIIEIIGENISLINSQRSEFASIIEKDGVDYLISMIASKTN